MNIKELEKIITVRTYRRRDMLDLFQVEATIQLHATRMFSAKYPEAKTRTTQAAREGLLRLIFEDQRRELYAAVLDVMRECTGCGMTEELHQAKERLFVAALRQPPKEYELFGWLRDQMSAEEILPKGGR